MSKKEERALGTMIGIGGVFNAWSNHTILSIPAVFACTTLIADSISTMPLKVKRDGLVIKDSMTDFRFEEPMLNMTYETWIQTIVRNILLDGNAYCHITSQELKIYDKIQVVTNMDDNGIIVSYELSDSGRKILPEDMLHFRGLTKDERGQVGMSLQENFVNLWELQKATDAHTMDYMKNGLMASLWLSVKGRMQKEDLKNLRSKFKELYQGIANRSSVPALTDGMELKQLNGNTLRDSSIDDLKNLQLKEIAMLFKVPLSLLDAGSANYGTTVEANLMFFKVCLSPIIKSIEGEINLKMNYGKKDKIFIDHDKFIAGSFNQQIETLARAVDSGILIPNEARNRLGYKDHTDGGKLYAPAGTPTPSESGAMSTPAGTQTSPAKKEL